MAVSDFWLEQAVDFVRQLKSQCERCSLCGAVSCGAKHADWHLQVQNKLDTAQTTIQNLRTRMTAAEDRLTALENPPA